MNHQFTIYRFMYRYGRQIIADLSEEQMKTPAFTGANPPSWIIGHLTVSADYGLKIMGQPMLAGKNWHVMFGPGSSPMKHLDKHPNRAELLAAYEAGHDAVLAALPNVNMEAMKAPSFFEPLLKDLPTLGDLLTHLVTSHEGFHVAQLSACRRAGGMSPLF
jgi:hypothetical protein